MTVFLEIDSTVMSKFIELHLQIMCRKTHTKDKTIPSALLYRNVDFFVIYIYTKKGVVNADNGIFTFPEM